MGNELSQKQPSFITKENRANQANSPVPNKQDITTRQPTLLERLSMWLVPLLLAYIQRIYGLTIRHIEIDKEHIEQLRNEGRPWIFSIWHTNVLFSSYLLRKERLYGLVSQSKDGEMITRVLQHFGHDTIRGSSSKGGAQGLRKIIKTLKKGHLVAMTPDGPRGPALELKEGIIHAARASGAPIVPFYYAATTQWTLHKSWDQHMIPKPFSTLVASYGPPIDVKSLSQTKNDQELIQEVQRQLMENVKRCQKTIEKIIEP